MGRCLQPETREGRGRLGFNTSDVTRYSERLTTDKDMTEGGRNNCVPRNDTEGSEEELAVCVWHA